MTNDEHEPRSAESFVGDRDGLERLWTPHRMAYVTGSRPEDDACVFCSAPQRTDEDALIVHRGQSCFVILNLYPYNAGHLLVCPYRHVADYADLSVVETTELAAVTQQAMAVLRTAMNPAGMNIGMNQGDVAGAGIAAHLHQHVVPRWRGDMNFFPIIAQTKAIPELLGDTRERLAQAWREM